MSSVLQLRKGSLEPSRGGFCSNKVEFGLRFASFVPAIPSNSRRNFIEPSLSSRGKEDSFVPGESADLPSLPLNPFAEEKKASPNEICYKYPDPSTSPSTHPLSHRTRSVEKLQIGFRASC